MFRKTKDQGARFVVGQNEKKPVRFLGGLCLFAGSGFCFRVALWV
ncbi:hypothetical protein LA5095_05459 [Roseibium album]|nr:hypothetical protein LA5095_05459 [Roseibium album]